mgnify:CR=1 FL=1
MNKAHEVTDSDSYVLPVKNHVRTAPNKRIGRRLVVSFVFLAIIVVGGSGWVLYRQSLQSLEDQMGDHLVSEVELIALGIAGATITELVPSYETTKFYILFVFFNDFDVDIITNYG